MSFPAALSAFARREWLTRRAGLIALVVLLAVPAMAREEARAAYALFFLLVVYPGLAFELAASRHPAGDRYWASLGGSPLERALTRTGAHLLLLLVTGLVAALPLHGSAWDPEALPGRALVLGGALTVAGLVYATASLARRSLSVGASLAGPLLAAVLIGAGGVLDDRIGAWSVVEGAAVRGGLLLAAALVPLLRWEGRLARRHEDLRLLLGGLGIVAAVTVAHLGWSGRPLVVPPTLEAIAPDGSASLYIPQQAGPLASRRALIWREGRGYSLVGPAGAAFGALLPGGDVALVTDGAPGAAWVGDADGGVGGGRTCVLPATEVIVARFARGEGATLVLLDRPRGALAVGEDGSCTFDAGDAGTSAGRRWGVGPGRSWVEGEEEPPRWNGGDIRDGRLYDRRTGASWPLPADPPPWSPVLVPQGDGPAGDGVRAFFLEGAVVDLGPEGERARHPLTLREAVGL